MSEPHNGPDSSRVDRAAEGDAILVYPPCHGRRVFVPIEEAVPGGARVRLVCPKGGEGWLVAFVADAEAESGLHAVWTDSAAGEGER